MKAKPKAINEDELLAALREASCQSGANGKGLTVAEMVSQYGIGKEKVLIKLKILQQEGRLVVGRKPHVRIDGAESNVPCYWVKQ